MYQEVNLCTNLSVGENVMLGHEPRHRRGIDWKATHREAERHLASLGLHLDTRSLLSSHSIAVQQLVAISRAMVLDARVLVLDEPTSSLDRDEVVRLFEVIRDLRDHGVAILFVSHFLEQVYEISDRITVLRNGRLVGEYRVKDLPRGDLVTKMVGRAIVELEAISEIAERGIDRATTPLLRATGVAGAACSSRRRRRLRGQGPSGSRSLARAGPSCALALRRDRRRRPRRGPRRAVRIASPRHALGHGSRSPPRTATPRGSVAYLTSARTSRLGIQAGGAGTGSCGVRSTTAVVTESSAPRRPPGRPDVLGLQPLSGGNHRRCCSPLAGELPI